MNQAESAGTAQRKTGAFSGIGVAAPRESTAFSGVGGGTSRTFGGEAQPTQPRRERSSFEVSQQAKTGAFSALGVAAPREYNPFSGVMGGSSASRTLDKDGIRDASQSQMNRLRGIENAAREQTGHGKEGIARTPFEKGMKFGERVVEKAMDKIRGPETAASKDNNPFSALGVEKDQRSVLSKITQAAKDAMEKHGNAGNSHSPREHQHEKQHQKRENTHAMGM